MFYSRLYTIKKLRAEGILSSFKYSIEKGNIYNRMCQAWCSECEKSVQGPWKYKKEWLPEACAQENVVWS